MGDIPHIPPPPDMLLNLIPHCLSVGGSEDTVLYVGSPPASSSAFKLLIMEEQGIKQCLSMIWTAEGKSKMRAFLIDSRHGARETGYRNIYLRRF